MGWTHAPFPQLKYPLDVHEQENAVKAQKCLKNVEKLINSNKIIGIIVEPIQSATNHQCSPSFYSKLREIANENEITFIGTLSS